MTGNPWYRILAPRPNARQRLIIVPHAGGGPAYYREWATRLPEWIEVVVVQLPGRASRWKEPAFKRIEPLLDALAPQLNNLLDRPVALFGHSLGALVAFELARRWSQEHRNFAGLIVAGAAGPQHPRTRSPLYSLSDHSLRMELARLGGTPTEVQANDELFELFLPTLRADLEVLETYAYRPGARLRVPLLNCGGNADGWATIDQLLDWSQMTFHRSFVRLYPGGHFFFNEQRERFLGDVQQFLDHLRLAPADIDLWRLNLDRLDDVFVLTEAEKARANRLLKPVVRDRFITARTQLRLILASYLTIDARAIALKTTDFGKPYLDPAVHDTDVRFNLSHSENVGLLAVSRGCDIGVDVEQIRLTIATHDLAKRYFSRNEIDDLEKLSEVDQPPRFFDYWSAKEAYIKARGRGLHIPLDEFDVPITSGPGPFVVVDRHTTAESGRWHVYPLNVTDGFAAAVCVDRPVGSIIFNPHQ